MGVPRILLLALLALAAGCALVDDRSGVEDSLVPGHRKADVFERLGSGASEVKVMADVLRPASGDWEEVIDDPAVLGGLIAADARSERPVMEYLYLRRRWSGFRIDDYHLFFDDRDRLIVWYRERIS